MDIVIVVRNCRFLLFAQRGVHNVADDEVDDREHQHDGLKQGLDHLDDGNLDERNGIVGRHHFHAVREIGAHVLNEGRHRI